MKCLEQVKHVRTESRLVFAQGWGIVGNEAVGNDCKYVGGVILEMLKNVLNLDYGGVYNFKYTLNHKL